MKILITINLFCLLFIVGCSTKKYDKEFKYEKDYQDYYSINNEDNRPNKLLVKKIDDTSIHFIFNPGDFLTLSVYKSLVLKETKQYKIDPAGNINLGGFVKLNIQGMTIDQAVSTVESAYRNQEDKIGYNWRAYIKKLNGQKVVHVRGAVNKTGFIKFVNGLTANKAIKLAGGIKNDGDLKNVEVSARGKVDKFIDLRKKTKAIHAGDIVFVNRKLQM